MTHDLAIINTFVLYIGFMMAIGVYYYRRTRNMSDYFLGNRKLGAWVTSLSAEASDMSGWMLMGVPGYAYLAGLNAGWIAVGIAIGTWANWHFVAARLRKYTELANNSLTLPEFLQNRFHDKSGLLRIVPAIFILIFFVIYTSSGFVSAGRLFETVFGVPYQYAIFIGAGSVVFYTLVGGFLAVSRTDFIQGVMMFFAILVVPICAAMQCGGFESTVAAISEVQSTMLEPLTKPDGSTMNAIEPHLAARLGHRLLRPAAHPRALHGHPHLEGSQAGHAHRHDLGHPLARRSRRRRHGRPRLPDDTARGNGL